MEETPKVETTPKKVYELDFPSKHTICGNSTMEEEVYEKKFTQVCESVIKNNSSFDTNIVKAFFEIAPIYGIDPVRAISQSILETGWFKYAGSAVQPSHHNYCGLGVTVNGKPGNIFDTIENGVRAQLQHLYAYGSKNVLPANETLIDERFKYVTRGIAPTWEELAGRWAVPGFDGSDPEAAIKNGTTYGQKIDKIYNSIIALSVSQEIIEKYFNKVESDVNTENQSKPIEPEQPKIERPENPSDNKGIDTTKVNTLLDIITKILTFILNLFKKN